MSHGKMIQILQAGKLSDSEQMNLKGDKIKEIIDNPLYDGNLKFMVISVTGAQKTGKSFLIHLLIRYLLHYDEANEPSDFRTWLADGKPLEDVQWTSNSSYSAAGIYMYMWDKPLIITNKKNETKIAVLLMDCSSVGDDVDYLEVYNSVITLTSLALSSVHILNCSESPINSDLEIIKTAIEHGKSGHFIDNLQMLLLLIRNSNIAESQRAYSSDKGIPPQLPEDVCDLSQGFLECKQHHLARPGKNIRKHDVKEKLDLQGLMLEDESIEFMEDVDRFFQLLFMSMTSDDAILKSREDLLRAVECLAKDGSGYFHKVAKDIVSRKAKETKADINNWKESRKAHISYMKSEEDFDIDSEVLGAKEYIRERVHSVKQYYGGSVYLLEWREVDERMEEVFKDFKDEVYDYMDPTNENGILDKLWVWVRNNPAVSVVATATLLRAMYVIVQWFMQWSRSQGLED